MLYCASVQKPTAISDHGLEIRFEDLGWRRHYLLMKLNLKTQSHMVKEKVYTVHRKQPQRTAETISSAVKAQRALTQI